MHYLNERQVNDVHLRCRGLSPWQFVKELEREKQVINRMTIQELACEALARDAFEEALAKEIKRQKEARTLWSRLARYFPFVITVAWRP